jgi:hypothetical protein
MAEAQWFYSRGNAQAGPVGEAELRRMAQAGELPPATLVWRAGMPQWQPAWQATDFFPAAVSEVPPPLPPTMPPPGAFAPPVAYATLYPYGAPPRKDIGDDPAMRLLLPVGRSPWAIVAGYLGLFSFVVLPAPLALVFSLIAISDLRKNPSQHGMGRAVFGLVMGILGTVALAAILVSAAAG